MTTSRLSDATLDELERFASEATPEEPEFGFDEDEVDDGSVAVVVTPRPEDAEFYAAALAALPSLLSEVRASRAAEADRERMREALSFAASVIKSGEPWTDTCERIFREALATEVER